MKLHKEGYKILRNQIIVYFLLGIVMLFKIKSTNSLILVSLSVFLTLATPICLIIFLFSLYFFRVPKRSFERKDGVIYSPCDGKVVVIEETSENEFYKEERIQISIFMSPLNIHNQIYPISGKIKYTKYHPGKFLVAWNPKASTDNERSTVVIENDKISMLIRQIAGAVARRIVTYSKQGETVKTSDELGFIKFGSRVDLFLPIGSKIEIKLEEKVIGGQSIIASY